MVGAEGFKLMNFHFELGWTRLGLWFIVLLIWFWKDLVGLVVDVRKLIIVYEILYFGIVLLYRKY